MRDYDRVTWYKENLVDVISPHYIVIRRTQEELPIDTSTLLTQDYNHKMLHKECVTLITEIPARFLALIYQIDYLGPHQTRIELVGKVRKLRGWDLWQMLEELKRADEAKDRIEEKYRED